MLCIILKFWGLLDEKSSVAETRPFFICPNGCSKQLLFIVFIALGIHVFVISVSLKWPAFMPFYASFHKLFYTMCIRPKIWEVRKKRPSKDDCWRIIHQTVFYTTHDIKQIKFCKNKHYHKSYFSLILNYFPFGILCIQLTFMIKYV